MQANKYIYFLMLLTAAANDLVAQVKSVGKIVAYQITSNGVQGRLDNDFFDIKVYSANTIRVTVSKSALIDSFSYSLVSNSVPAFYQFKVSDSASKLVVTTESIILPSTRFSIGRLVALSLANSFIW